MTIGSLFDGAGTACLAASMCGIEPVWVSEIEPFAVAVEEKNFPNAIQYGDITKMDGGKIVPVDIIVGGSPCQDISIAGRKAGLKDGERSSLFFEMIRVIRQMRIATNGKNPRYVIWENVPGAFSSQKGEDFYEVIKEFCRIGEESVDVPRPKERNGKLDWRPSGLVVGRGWSFGWRTVDAQYWGVPQRRRRIYAVLDLGGESVNEILFERKGLQWNYKEIERTRKKASEGTARRFGVCHAGGYAMTGTTGNHPSTGFECCPALKARDAVDATFVAIKNDTDI